jgi:phytoene synthase
MFSYGLRMAPSSDLLDMLRRADPDRYFCTLFAPAEKRLGLAVLYLFNHELARAREVASEPVLALIRLQWWREVVEGQPKHHEIATPLTAALAAGWFAPADLLGLIAAREAEAEPEIPDLAAFLAYARATAGSLARIAGKYLGADAASVEDLGTAYGIHGILRAAPYLARQHRALLPADGTPRAALLAHGRSLLGAKPPRAALPAALPAVFARYDPDAPRGPWQNLAVLRAAITGKI